MDLTTWVGCEYGETTCARIAHFQVPHALHYFLDRQYAGACVQRKLVVAAALGC
jgi:hypothetical protein